MPRDAMDAKGKAPQGDGPPQPCGLCKQTEFAGMSCVPGRKGSRIPFGHEFHVLAIDPRTGSAARRCPACKTPMEGFHHAGCRLEECPACQSSAWKCGCVPDRLNVILQS